MCDVSLGKTIWFPSFKLGRFTETLKVVHAGDINRSIIVMVTEFLLKLLIHFPLCLMVISSCIYDKAKKCFP